jgi:hypothetical protein
MKQLEKILIPTDLSEHSRRAHLRLLARKRTEGLVGDVARCQRVSCMGVLF